MSTELENLIYVSHYMKGRDTNVNDDYIETNEVYGMLLKAKDIGYKLAVNDIKTIIDNRMTENLAAEGNSAGGRFFGQMAIEDNDILADIDKLTDS